MRAGLLADMSAEQLTTLGVATGMTTLRERCLELVHKGVTTFDEFATKFAAASERAGKEQYLIPYFIASHPGSDVHAMIDLALFLKRNGYRPDQVQDFIPAPFDIATAMYYTGIDPFTKQQVYVAKGLRDRKMQRALMQFFKPENWFTVREALIEAKRTDLIGDGCDCLIPADPPKEALEARRRAVLGHDDLVATDVAASGVLIATKRTS